MMSKFDWKRMSAKHKNNKLTYYICGYFVMWFNSKYASKHIKYQLKKIKNYDHNYIEKRVNYYNKLTDYVYLKNYIFLKDFTYTGEYKTYYLDIFKFKRYFKPNNKLSYLFGDIIHIPNEPSIVKSRPIKGNNKNSILLNLNKIRHFLFIKDKIKFEDKNDMLVWRGKINNLMPHREEFFKTHFANKYCNIGVVNNFVKNKEWIKPRLTIDEQLNYKFILSIEGNDVATNLKWIMSSNSVAVMPKPKYETWFMEGTLIPDFHYICIKDDYSDLEEKLAYYTNNPNKCFEIIRNANTYVSQFIDKDQEKIISLLVLKKYFELVNSSSIPKNEINR